MDIRWLFCLWCTGKTIHRHVIVDAHVVGTCTRVWMYQLTLMRTRGVPQELLFLVNK